MLGETMRERCIRLIHEMRQRTVDRGATPAEAAAFAAKVAALVEKYQIEEAELRAAAPDGGGAPEVEVCQNKLRTGVRVFNPGRTALVNGLAVAVGCRCILLHEGDDAVYGIVGDVLDADYVCSMAVTLYGALTTMAKLEGAEHGYEHAGLVRWCNQYLTGASIEIKRRIEEERRQRSEARRIEHERARGGGTALAVITGESLFAQKKELVEEMFAKEYPKTRTARSRSEFDPTAHERGREAGKRVGLHRAVGNK